MYRGAQWLSGRVLDLRSRVSPEVLCCVLEHDSLSFAFFSTSRFNLENIPMSTKNKSINTNKLYIVICTIHTCIKKNEISWGKN